MYFILYMYLSFPAARPHLKEINRRTNKQTEGQIDKKILFNYNAKYSYTQPSYYYSFQLKGNFNLL